MNWFGTSGIPVLKQNKTPSYKRQRQNIMKAGPQTQPCGCRSASWVGLGGSKNTLRRPSSSQVPALLLGAGVTGAPAQRGRRTASHPSGPGRGPEPVNSSSSWKVASTSACAASSEHPQSLFLHRNLTSPYKQCSAHRESRTLRHLRTWVRTGKLLFVSIAWEPLKGEQSPGWADQPLPSARLPKPQTWRPGPQVWAARAGWAVGLRDLLKKPSPDS